MSDYVTNLRKEIAHLEEAAIDNQMVIDHDDGYEPEYAAHARINLIDIQTTLDHLRGALAHIEAQAARIAELEIEVIAVQIPYKRRDHYFLKRLAKGGSYTVSPRQNLEDLGVIRQTFVATPPGLRDYEITDLGERVVKRLESGAE